MEKFKLKSLRALIAILVILLLSLLVLGREFGYYAVWWLTLLIIGLINFPLTYLIFSRFKSKGYIFSKIIGFAVTGYIVWLLGSFKIFKFTSVTCYAVVILLAAVNFYIAKRKRLLSEISGDAKLISGMIWQEALFMLLLLWWTYLRGVKPDIGHSLEAYMDFGFVNSILRSDYFPPKDIWFAGESINYYYLGHYFSAFLTRLSTLPSSYTYNLLMASLFSLTFMGSYTIAGFLFDIFAVSAVKTKIYKAAKPICCVITGALTTLSGNLHTPIYAWFSKVKSTIGDGSEYWFPNATRYIGHNPVVAGDQTIHEFPIYSYVVSDLHAHVINLLFVLTAVAAALSFCAVILHRTRLKSEQNPEADLPAAEMRNKLHDILISCKPTLPYIAMVFMMGMFPATNFWDYPIYLVVAACFILFANLKAYKFSLKSFLVTAVQLVIAAVCAYILTLPFSLGLMPMTKGIARVKISSKLYQLFVLYGYQFLFFVMILVSAICVYKNTYISPRLSPQKNAKSSGRKIPKREYKNIVADFLSRLNPADGFVILLFICAIGLVIIPEIIYIKDLYPSAPRANTMFKLTYQAFVMFTIGVGYTSVRLFLVSEERLRVNVMLKAVICVLLVFAFAYPFYAISRWYPKETDYSTISGTAYLQTYESEQYSSVPEGETNPRIKLMADDYDLINWMNANIKGQSVIAEADGYSYSEYGRISAMTGLQSIFGWYTHEDLWRGSQYEQYNERSNDIRTIYTSTEAEVIRQVLNKYDVSYIVVGKLEYKKYGNTVDQSLNALLSLGETVFSQNGTLLIRVS